MSDNNAKLLKNKQAVEEINRHRWIESEKAGHDIGFESASTDWLEKFSSAWMQYHMPKRKTAVKSQKSPTTKKTSSRKSSKASKSRAKKK